ERHRGASVSASARGRRTRRRRWTWPQRSQPACARRRLEPVRSAGAERPMRLQRRRPAVRAAISRARHQRPCGGGGGAVLPGGHGLASETPGMRVARLAGALCATLFGGSVLFAQDVAIVGATLIDGKGGPPVSDSVVVVRGQRIPAPRPPPPPPPPPRPPGIRRRR